VDGADDRPLDEAALLHRVKEGDATAFATLFDRHAERLAAGVRRLVPPAIRRKVSVSDVLQETRIAAYLGVADFEDRGGGAFRAWLLRIAQHKAQHAVERYGDAAKRSVRREVTQGARRATAAHAAGGPSPSEAAMGLELAQAVHRAIASLPPAYREVLRLTRIEGRTLADAAGRMGRTREAVKKLYGRAMTRFAAAYAAQTGPDRG
jgi:RNA polymerase sigma-70 factor (ECF subfamily)